MESGQTGKSIYTAICLLQKWLQLTVNGTAMKLTATNVRACILVSQRKNLLLLGKNGQTDS